MRIAIAAAEAAPFARVHGRRYLRCPRCLLTFMHPDDRIDADAELWAALQEMDRDGVNQLPVTRDNRVAGMLSREDVITFLRTLQELAA